MAATATVPETSLQTPLRVRLGWIGLIAFASGFPFGLVNETVAIYLRVHGASLIDIGYLNKLSLPWSLKWLWAPLVDRNGSRRTWIASCLAGMTGLTLVLGHLQVASLGNALWALLIAMAILSATQDVAIDAYTIQSTTTRELGVANSVRITLYRIAMLTAGGLLIWLAGRIGWTKSFTVGATLFALLTVGILFLPPVARVAGTSRDLWEPLRALYNRRRIASIVVFALTFKFDIAALEPMMRPFWVDRGLTLEEIGAVVTSGRVVATVVGAAAGGVFTTRYGIFTGLWVLGLVQACSSLGYWAVATAGPAKGPVIAAAYFESFAAGLGTAAYLAFLMSVCEKRYAATQFAVLSALLALTRWVAGDFSGRWAEQLGYGNYFLLTFLLGLPAFVLIPRLRQAAMQSTGQTTAQPT